MHAKNLHFRSAIIILCYYFRNNPLRADSLMCLSVSENVFRIANEFQSKRGIPAVAVKYVEAVNAAPVIKNRTSAYDELGFYDESLGRFH